MGKKNSQHQSKKSNSSNGRQVSIRNSYTQNTPLDIARFRLGLSEQLEMTEALQAIRRGINEGWLMEAEVLCRFVLANRPEQPDAWALRGETALADKDPASARVFFQEALRSLDFLPSAQDLRKQRFAYWRAIAECNTQLNRRELAEEAFVQMARYDENTSLSTKKEEVGKFLSNAYSAILQNKLDEAEPLIKAVLKIEANNAFAWQGLAVIEHKRGNHSQAATAIDKAIELKPDESSFWNNRGVVLKPLGMPKIEERISAYQRATSLNSEFKEAYSNLADALTSARKYEEAQKALNKALSIDPSYVGARINEVNLLKAKGLKNEALISIESILEQVRHPEALNLKGALLLETGDAHEAIKFLEESRQLDSRNPSVLNNLGNAYLATSRASKAIEAYRSAVILSPGMAEAQANLALGLLTQIHHGAPQGEYLALAKNHLAKAQSLDPNMPELFVAEGILKAQHQNDREGSMKAYERALDIQPESVQALMGLSGIAGDLGDRKRARALLKRAAELAPDDAGVMTAYIFALNYDPATSPIEIYEAALAYGQHIQKRVGNPYSVWPNSREVNKRLKIGFVSGDLKRHPISYLVLGLIKNLKNNNIDTFIYNNYQHHDDMTQKIRNETGSWRDIEELSTESVCDLIKSDEIDVLIDLSGHTGYHRLDVFAKKPAPVQATYLGFHSGTGLTGIDYYIIDEKMAAGVQQFFLEKITHLEYSWNIDESLLPLKSRSLNSPHQRKGYITLGSLNNPIKFNDETIDAWVQIMKKCPTAVLHHRSKIFADPSVREAFVNRFVKHGVASDRILCEGALSRDEALAWLSEEVDIGLDPFPYGSHTTGLESIAMGVPMVSFFGERIPSRVCAVFMERLGLQNWVARSHAEYVDTTVQLIQQPEKIQEARSHILKIAKDTQLLDSVSFADSFSKVMNSLWNNYVTQSFKGDK